MSRFGASPHGGFLDLDEISHAGLGLNARAVPQVREGADEGVGSDFRIGDVATGPDDSTVADSAIL